MSIDATDAEVFVYTGPGGDDVPREVIRVRIDPSVTSIANAFYKCKKLAEVELCEGLVEIGQWSFWCCGHSITKIDIPTSLRRICNQAFYNSLRCSIRLHDGIESIGIYAFGGCIFTNFRIPPLITVIPTGILAGCKSIFSAEIPYNVMEIGNNAFVNCHCLRNVAFPPNAVIGNDVIIRDDQYDEDDRLWTDLEELFEEKEIIVRELRHRFDELHVHSVVYYQSYHEKVLQRLLDAINMRSGQRQTLRSKLDPTGNQQDCLGMTPLHILACSSVHDLELYRVIVDNYPTNLITEDEWGALPLLYAFWGAAPVEIIEFLLNSYHSLYPNYVFNWTMMVETMGRCHTPKENIESLLCAKQTHFPEQPLDWESVLTSLLTEFAMSTSRFINELLFQEQMHFLLMCGMSVRVESLAFKLWRDYVIHMINTATFGLGRGNSDILHRVCGKLAHFEDKLTELKEVTTILELALWKMKISQNGHQDMATHYSNIRSQDRVTCGADVVIGHVLPFLINTD
jgi:hypothetical protein